MKRRRYSGDRPPVSDPRSDGPPSGAVCMFVRNAFEFDARVEREATALAAAGYSVTVVALKEMGRLPARERRGAIEVRRISRWFWVVDRLRAAWVQRARPEGGGPADRSPVTAGLDAMQRSWTAVRRIGPVDRVRDAAIALRMIFVGLGTRADVYHAHDLNTLAAASWCARIRRARLVYDAHEIAPGQEGIQDPAATERKERRLIRRADAVIHTTPLRARWAAETYGITMPSVVLNVPDVAGRIEPHDLSAVFGFAPGSRVLLHQGGIQPNRGLEALVRATADLEEPYVLAFLGGGRGRPSLEALVRELGLQERVRFKGPVPHAELLRYTAGAWCGFSLLVDSCTNHRWSLPNKLFECLAAGVPIVVSANPEIAGFVSEHGIGEACDPTDASSIVAAIRRLAGRYDAARDAAVRAGERYRWSVEKERLMEVYRGLGTSRRDATDKPHALRRSA